MPAHDRDGDGNSAGSPEAGCNAHEGPLSWAPQVKAGASITGSFIDRHANYIYRANLALGLSDAPREYLRRHVGDESTPGTSGTD